MPGLITLDFETYYDKEYSLRKLTTEEYIRDDRFEVIGVGVKVNDEDAQWFSGSAEDTKKFLSQFDWDRSILLAHNTAFDGAILRWRFGITPKGYADTMSMGLALGDGVTSMSLDAMASRYELGRKGTEVHRAEGKRREDFSAEDLSAYADYCLLDVSLCFLLFHILVEREFPKSELKLIDMTLRMFICPMLELDTHRLEDYLGKLQAKQQALLGAIEADRSQIMSNPKFAELLQQVGVDPPMKVSRTTGKPTYAFARTDEAFRALLEHPDPRVQTLVAARLGLKSTIEETRTQRLLDISMRGPLPVPIKYCGARTKRWSGEGGGINMQNLPRKSVIKQAIRAPKGHMIVGVDLSNIELRIGLWFGGMTRKLDLLRNGLDLYKDFAAQVFDTPYDAVTPEQRFIGKTSQLSLIYGVGAEKLRAAIKAGSGKDIGADEARRIVSLYRGEYWGVTSAWDRGDIALRAILNDNHYEFGPTVIEGRKGQLLPCGLHIHYPQLHRTTAGWEYRARYGMEHIYGAKMFQGTIQALARCVIADGMLRCRKNRPDVPTVLTVHDASYVLAQELLAPMVMTSMIEDLCVPPAWAPDLPLAAEGGFGPSLADC